MSEDIRQTDKKIQANVEGFDSFLRSSALKYFNNLFTDNQNIIQQSEQTKFQHD